MKYAAIIIGIPLVISAIVGGMIFVTNASDDKSFAIRLTVALSAAGIFVAFLVIGI